MIENFKIKAIYHVVLRVGEFSKPTDLSKKV